MNGHEKRRQEIEKKIVNTAIDLFQRYGFKRISVSEIAKNARVSQVTLYKYFKNKHVLIRECIRVYFERKADEYTALMKADIPYMDKLSAMMKDKIKVLNSFEKELSLELQDQDDEYLKEIILIRRKAISESVHLFEEGRQAGFISNDISDEAILTYLDIFTLGILSSSMYREFEKKNPNAFEEIQNLAAKCIMNEVPK